MSSKIRPDDWDRLFAPNARRRGGPLRALAAIIATLLIVALVGAGVQYGLAFRQQRFEQAAAAATAQAPTDAAIRAATAQVKLNATATIGAARTATAVAQTPVATPAGRLTATVFNGGNVRAAPVSGDPLDQVNAGETVQLLEKNAGASWFKVTYSRNGQTITGWISKTLLTIDPAVEDQVPLSS